MPKHSSTKMFWSKIRPPIYFRQAPSEVDRYIAWPGQALGYKLGEMTILRLRAKAKEKLKERFDIKTFHDAVLDGGPMPLSVLEQKLDDWLAAQ